MQKISFLTALLFLNISLLNAQIDSAKSTSSANTEQAKMVEKIKKGFLNHSLADFNFKDVNGNKLNKKDLKGKVIVINFWFTTCQPCIQEIPLLNE